MRKTAIALAVVGAFAVAANVQASDTDIEALGTAKTVTKADVEGETSVFGGLLVLPGTANQKVTLDGNEKTKLEAVVSLGSSSVTVE